MNNITAILLVTRPPLHTYSSVYLYYVYTRAVVWTFYVIIIIELGPPRVLCMYAGMPLRDLCPKVAVFGREHACVFRVAGTYTPKGGGDGGGGGGILRFGSGVGDLEKS